VAEATTTDTTHSKAGHKDHGTKRYFIVWAVLLVLTATTVWTGRMSPNIYLAMTIAVVKASLVVLFFMHMTEAAGTNRIVFITSFVFMIVMMLGVFGDLWTRSEMSLPSGAPSTLAPEIQVPGEAPPAHHE